MKSSIIGMLILWAVAAGAQAQLATQGPPTHFEGYFVRYTEDNVTVRREDGIEITVPMTSGWYVAIAREADLSLVQEGDYIASRNLPLEEGVGRSQELRVYRENYRPEEGSHMMGDAPTAMTHGDVSRLTRTAEGLELDISYPSGSRRLLLDNSIPVTTYDVLDRAVLQPGVHIDIVARKDAEGILRAGRVTLE